MTAHDITRSPLAFNHTEIHEQGEMLSLTDMWRASGAVPHQKPSDWLRDLGTQTFIEFVADRQKVLPEHLFRTSKGRNGVTFGHWQIGLAYAKYLSPEFHMWCNTVVRERMEGRPAEAALPAKTVDDIARSLGIVKSTIHKVTELEKVVRRLEATHPAPTFDLASTVTSDMIIEMVGVNRKERVRGTTVMITNAMLDFCDGSGCFRTPADLNPARPWRFPREKARDWLFGPSFGGERVRNQIAAQRRRKDKKGQGALRLVPPPDAPPL